ncbi:MAG: NUDIX hydrolase N-terminal domain-containing protein [Anaerolineaceae bacterium]|nr:NUDIX hydrolase N-terminal domain-containing protein [Anaerolineaceae bacterium]
MNVSARLSGIADRLRDTAAFGLRFAKGSHEQERFRAVQDMAIELFALATDSAVEAFEPIRRSVLSRPTPFVAGDAAIIDDAGRILLIQRTDNHKWAMPGGALEVGETAASGVEREALEETGVCCRATALVGIHDSRLCGTPTPFQLYHLLFLCQPTDDTTIGNGSHRHEVLDVRWFERAELTTVDLDPGHAARIPEAYRVWSDGGPAYFDRSAAAGGPTPA